MATDNPLRDLLLACLRDPRYDQFRFMVAFARWSGLFLLDTDLQSFAQRRGTSIRGYVGTDLGGTTIEALTYLSELPKAEIFVVDANTPAVVFHPKIFEFSGTPGWLTVIGSSNMTMGGLLSNVEASVVLTGDSSDPCPTNLLFDQLTPAPPFTLDHVRRVTDDLLTEIAPRLDHYTKPSPDSRGDISPSRPPLAELDLPLPGRPPSPASARRAQRTRSDRRTRPGPVRTSASATAKPEILFVELWDETRNGTQVQLPRRVFTDYFGADVTAVTWVTVRAPGGGLERIRLQAFPNATFRISLPFVGTSSPRAGRRAVLRFERLGQDEYSCTIARRGERQYESWLRACTEQTTRTSKRFGIVSAPVPRVARHPPGPS